LSSRSGEIQDADTRERRRGRSTRRRASGAPGLGHLADPGSTINPSGLATYEPLFCQMLGARDADRDRKSKLCPHALADYHQNFGRLTGQLGAARDVGKGLVDGA